MGKIAPKALEAVGGLFGKGAAEAGDAVVTDATDEAAEEAEAAGARSRGEGSGEGEGAGETAPLRIRCRSVAVAAKTRENGELSVRGGPVCPPSAQPDGVWTGTVDEWSFAVDEDGLVIVKGPLGTDENVRLAVETLIIPFGTRVGSFEIYLREWRRMWREFEAGYVLGTSSATARRADLGRVEIGDLYGQFETTTIGVDSFEHALECAIAFLKGRGAASVDRVRGESGGAAGG